MCKLCVTGNTPLSSDYIHGLGKKHLENLLSGGSAMQSKRPAAHPSSAGSVGHRILIRGGDVLTMDEHLGDFAGGDVLIDGERIVAVGQRLEVSDAEVIDARGKIVMPGFIDTHHHQFETALRSALANGLLVPSKENGNELNYLEHVLGRLAPQYRPEDVYISELFGSLSQLDAGVTTVLDVSQIHHSPEHTDAAVAALLDAGRRSVLGYFEGHGEKLQYPHDASRLRHQYFSSDDQLVTMMMGGEIFLPGWEKSWEIADELDLRIALHAVGSMGLSSSIEALVKDKRINERHLLIHMTGMSDATWEGVRDAGASVSLAVPIEMSMRHGMPPILKTLAMGLLPSLSSDVECTLTADFFTQMRATLTLQRAFVNEMAIAGEANIPALLTARDVIRFATRGGALALGMDEITGSISVGKAADIILLDAEALNVAPLNNVPGAVVTLMERCNVDTVMVAGRIRKWQGKLLDSNIDRLREAVTNSRNAVFERSGINIPLF